MTRIYGSYATLGSDIPAYKNLINGKIRAFVDYTVTNNLTNYKIVINSFGLESGGITINQATGEGAEETYLEVEEIVFSGGGYSTYTDDSFYDIKGSKPSGTILVNRTLSNYSRTINKQTSSQSITLNVKTTFSSQFVLAPTKGYSFTNTFSITIPALDKYTIGYNLLGGSPAISSQTKYAGQTITISTITPSKEGYVFLGWGTSEGSSPKYQPGATYSDNASITLYAIWALDNKRLITFNSVRGSNIPKQEYKYDGVPYTIPDQIPQDPDYTFQGWDTQSAAATVVYRPGDIYEENEQLTLYAVWLKNIDISSPGATLQCERVNENGNSDDASTYVKVSSILDVNSVWATETHLSIEAMEANVQVQTEPIRHAVTIKPAVDIPKAEDTYSSRHNITWKSYDDQIEFTADKSYDVTMKAEVYRTYSNAVNTDITNPFSDLPQTLKNYEDADTQVPPIRKRIDLDFPGKFVKSITLPQIEKDSDIIYAKCTLEKPTDDSKYVNLVVSVPSLTYDYPYAFPLYADSNLEAVKFEWVDSNGEVNSVNIDVPDSFKASIMSGSVYTLPVPDDIVFEGANSFAVVGIAKGPDVMVGPPPYPESYYKSLAKPVALVSYMTVDTSGERPVVVIGLEYPEILTAYIPQEWRSSDFLVGLNVDSANAKELVATATKTGTILDAEFVMDFHESGKGMAIGGIAPSDGLLIGWNTEIDADLRVNGPFMVTRVEQEEIEGQPVDVDIPIFEVNTIGQEGKVTSHIPTEVNSTLIVKGDSHTRNITLDQDPYARIMRAGRSDSWVNGHKTGSLINLTSAPGDGSYSGALSMKTAGGNWGVGVSREDLAISYIKKSSLDANQNTSYVTWITPPLNGSFTVAGMRREQSGNYWGLISPTGSNTDWVRSPNSGLLPFAPNTCSLGNSSWYWANLYVKAINGHTMNPNYVVASITWKHAKSGSVSSSGTGTVTMTHTVNGNCVTYAVVPYTCDFGTVESCNISRSGNVITATCSVRNTVNAAHSMGVDFYVLEQYWGLAQR